MHFDRGNSRHGVGVEVVLIAQSSMIFLNSFGLKFEYTSNKIKYEVLLMKLKEQGKLGLKKSMQREIPCLL